MNKPSPKPELKIAFICATKGREKLFHKKAYPFLLSTGYPFLVGVEEPEAENYGQVENMVTYPQGTGLSGSLAILAERSGADLIFKIDDDVSGFTGEGEAELLKNLPRFVLAFEQYENLGGVAFPYDHEFYHTEKRLFNYMNHRLQTCYIVRSRFFKSKRRHDPFEDFCIFLEICDSGHYTLLCPVNKIRCSPVGETAGGLNDGNRPEKGFEAIKKIQRDFPNFQISVKHKPNKSWQFEPDFSENPMLKKKRI